MSCIISMPFITVPLPLEAICCPRTFPLFQVFQTEGAALSCTRYISSCENIRSVVKNNTHSVDSGTIKLGACHLASFATLLSFECKCQVGDPTLPADITGCLPVIEKSKCRALGCADSAAHLVVVRMQIIESHYQWNRQLGYQRTFRLLQPTLHPSAPPDGRPSGSRSPATVDLFLIQRADCQ